MALKTMTNSDFKIRTPPISHSEIIFADKPPKYVQHYQIGAKIGKGSYATVREAIDVDTNEIVAIKICSKRKLAKIPGGLRAVRKESKILYHLDDKNTIRLREKFTIPEKEKIYLIMDYITCGNLDHLMRRNRGNGLPLKQIQSLFTDLLNGLKYLRHKRIVHGDIKPENLLLSSEGHLVISDFGVSRMLRKKRSRKNLSKKSRNSHPSLNQLNSNSQSDMTHTSDRTSEESLQFSDEEEGIEEDSKIKENSDGENYGMNHTAQGTFAYEPPEVASGIKKYSKCGYELDLWAAGIVLYFMSTGRYPFSGTSFLEIVENISNGVFEDLPSDLDSDLVFTIKSMLSVDAKQRPSIEEIFDHPFMKKEFKCKKFVKMIENESIFTRKKDGKYYFGDKKEQSECVIC